jgi:diaminopimelate epimerase
MILTPAPCEIVIADPAKNITIFVLTKFDDPAERLKAAHALLADPSLKAEQVGFVIPPDPAAGRPLWRLEMMGGEFCGNAARSFGLFVARETGMVSVTIEISGMKTPLNIEVDVEAGRAEAAIPPPESQSVLSFEGKTLPVIMFDGITHVIAPDFKPSEDTFYAIKNGARHHFEKGARHLFEAFGVMFYDTASRFMIPAVYVHATESLVFESSCGSGSAALGVWKTQGLTDGETRLDIAQPGGIIEVRVNKSGGNITGLFIGGQVSLSGRKQTLL